MWTTLTASSKYREPKPYCSNWRVTPDANTLISKYTVCQKSENFEEHDTKATSQPEFRGKQGLILQEQPISSASDSLVYLARESLG